MSRKMLIICFSLSILLLFMHGCGSGDMAKQQKKRPERQQAQRGKENPNAMAPGQKLTLPADDSRDGAGIEVSHQAAKPASPLGDSRSYMSRDKAISSAAKILVGDPYGMTTSEVKRNIKSTRLSESGENPCCLRSKPVWVFHVVVPNTDSGTSIDGYLVLDARDGSFECAGLPFLD